MTERCGPRCWMPVRCPSCGNRLPPRGRSSPLEMSPDSCCAEAQNTQANTRHLWSEHDSTRHYTDPEGWAAHVRDCEECR